MTAKSAVNSLGKCLNKTKAPKDKPPRAGQPIHLPNLEHAAKFLEDLPALWLHPGVTHEEREARVREVFRRITIDGKDFVDIEPEPEYALFSPPW